MRINSASAAIDALGGNNAVAKLFGLNYRVVTNWRSRGLPPDTYAVMAPALMARGYEFSPLLFAQKMIARPRRQAATSSPPT